VPPDRAELLQVGASAGAGAGAGAGASAGDLAPGDSIKVSYPEVGADGWVVAWISELGVLLTAIE
jgi:hypothetical protein